MKSVRTILGCFVLCLLLAGCASGYRSGVKDLEDGEYEAAIEDFTNEIEEEKNVAESYRGIGLSYWEQGNYTSAAEAFTQALDAGAEETATIYGLLGNCQYLTGEYESAISSYEKGLKLGDGSDELNQSMSFNIIAAYEKLDDFDSAKERLSEYTKQYPDDEAARKEAEFLETQ